MIDYFIILIILTFLVFSVFFANERLAKSITYFPFSENKEAIRKKLRTNKYFSLALILLCLIVASFHVIFPEVKPQFHLQNILACFSVNYVAAFVIKISFIWLIISGLHISLHLDFSREKITLKKIFKTEVFVLFPLVLMCLGTFIFFANILSALILFVSLLAVLLRMFTYVISVSNPDRTA